MASIQKMPNNTYRIRFWVTENGEKKQKSKQGFKTKREANVWMAKFVTENVNEDGVVKRTVYTLPEYFEKWYTTYKSDKEKATIYQYEQTLSLIKKYFPKRQLKDFSRTEFQEFLNNYGADHSIESVAKKRGQMKQCLRAAYADGLIDRDPTYGIEPTGQKPEKKEKHLSVDEYIKIIDYVEPLTDNPIMLLIYIAAKTGMRTGEVRALTAEDFDFINKTVRINKSAETSGKAKTTKTPAGTRTISVDDKLLQAVSGHVGRLSRVSGNSVNNNFRKVLKAIGSNKDLTLYSLRHTHGSFLLMNNVSISYVSERLGHSDIYITMRVYAHLLDKQKVIEEEKTVEILNNL